MDISTDVIIAGAGLAGLLCLQRLSQKFPAWNITLLEREAWIGGRLRPTLKTEGSWSCGLQGISASLYDYLAGNELIRQENIGQARRGLGVMSGHKISELAYSEMSTAEMAKILGGSAAVRDWPLVEELLNTPLDQLGDSDQAFSHAWKADRKSAALVVLEHLAHSWGLPELGPASLRTLVVQAQMHRQGQWCGRWDQLFLPLIEELKRTERLQVETRAQIMAARFQENSWIIASTRGTFKAPRLLVAQSPWEAILWLPKDLWPTAALNLSAKTKPVSLVILSDSLPTPATGLPETLLIPAEEVQVISDGTQICYQATLSYELTVQAPAVVKAVKRLKRAKKKLLTALPDLQASSGPEHIALLPVAWAHAAIPQEQRWFHKIDQKNLQQSHLGFCSDAYGGESNSDQNLIRSVEALLQRWSD